MWSKASLIAKGIGASLAAGTYYRASFLLSVLSNLARAVTVVVFWRAILALSPSFAGWDTTSVLARADRRSGRDSQLALRVRPLSPRRASPEPTGSDLLGFGPGVRGNISRAGGARLLVVGAAAGGLLLHPWTHSLVGFCIPRSLARRAKDLRRTNTIDLNLCRPIPYWVRPLAPLILASFGYFAAAVPVGLRTLKAHRACSDGSSPWPAEL